jgi:hypothetical protein
VVLADVGIGNLHELAGKFPADAADLRAIAAWVREICRAGRAALSSQPEIQDSERLEGSRCLCALARYLLNVASRAG